MKKTKILMPLITVSALGVTIAPILTLTSCGNKPDASIKKIEATSQYQNTYVGATITKDDIEVVVHKVDGVIEQTTEFTCDIPEAGYKFEKVESKVFTIQYKGHSTTIKFSASDPGELFLDVSNMELEYSTDFSTSKTFGIYAYTQGSLITEIPHDYFTITSDNANVVYNKETKCIEAKGTTNAEATISVTLTQFPEVVRQFKVTVVAPKQITKATKSGTSASVKLSQGNDEGILSIPDYVKIGTESLPVTTFTTDDDVHTIHTLVIPTSITKIPENAFVKDADKAYLTSIIYLGDKAGWRSISKAADWQGTFAMGVYCLGGEEYEYINFTNCLDTTFITSEKSQLKKDTLGLEKNVGDTTADNYTIQFDYSLIPEDADDYEWIEFRDYNRFAVGGFSIKEVYIGNTLIPYDGQGTPNPNTYSLEGWSNKGGRLVFNNLDATLKLSSNSVITIKFKTPGLSADSVWAGACKATN